jgi:hypothetical protein
VNRHAPGPPARLAAFLALALAGCPLPQAVPSYPGSGAIAPPRIDTDTVSPSRTLIEVRPDCPVEPAFTLSASIVDEDTLEADEARWFVDYDPGVQARWTITFGPKAIPAPSDGLATVRPVLPWTFHPYGFDPAGSEQAFRDGGGLHVVELVVSNGFAPQDDPAAALPNRSTQANFQTQVFRWVFHYAAGGVCALP